MEREKSAFEELGSRETMSAADARAIYEFNNPGAKGGTREGPADSKASATEVETGKTGLLQAREAMREAAARKAVEEAYKDGQAQ